MEEEERDVNPDSRRQSETGAGGRGRDCGAERTSEGTVRSNKGGEEKEEGQYWPALQQHLPFALLIMFHRHRRLFWNLLYRTCCHHPH